MISVGMFEPNHIPALYDVYRTVTAPLPHCRFYPSVEHFGHSLSHPGEAGVRVLVAEEDGTAVGFASLWPTKRAEDGVEEAEITTLFSPREVIVEELLRAAIELVSSVERLVAFPPEHGRCVVPSYNASWSSLSDQHPVVTRVLARHGFVPYYRELLLELRGTYFPPVVTPLIDDIELAPRIEEHERILVARQGEDRAGVCVYTTLVHLTDHPEAKHWGYIDWLHVESAFRRRGLARALLTRTLKNLAAEGCDGCWLTTGAENWPAQPLYFAMGFEIVASTASFRRTLR
jgi:ribosomal protein S18 acetylase RimI-like enzyme